MKLLPWNKEWQDKVEAYVVKWPTSKLCSSVVRA
jgi:hypothetical protein